jgi:anti-sigma B factor antagonist
VLDEGEVPLRRAVDKALSEGRINILLDMRGVTRLDSAGIGMVVSVFLSTFRHGGKLKLLHLTDRGGHLMFVTKLATVFEIFEDEEKRSELRVNRPYVGSALGASRGPSAPTIAPVAARSRSSPRRPRLREAARVVGSALHLVHGACIGVAVRPGYTTARGRRPR